MSEIYRLHTREEIHVTNPLHVSNFYSPKRLHKKSMQDRQDLVLFLANLHNKITGRCVPVSPLGFPFRLTSLRNWVYNYESAFDHFFTIVKHGYKISNDDLEISYIAPKKINALPDKFLFNLEYSPPPLPDDGVVSKVFLRKNCGGAILARLHETGRVDLLAPVEWLLRRECSEINFYFSTAGKLRARDTSTWPIAGIETWPSWLRTALFGAGIDIDSAYVQFLLMQIEKCYAGRESLVELIFPDLIQMLHNKSAWRRELCEDIFNLPVTTDNINFIKKICMGIANGSKISSVILIGDSEFSEIKNLICTRMPDVQLTVLTKIGDRLSVIAGQFLAAKKLICNSKLGLRANKNNVRQVFVNYFEWERSARYKIWEAVDCHGLMVHDGIDGVPQIYLDKIDDIIRSLNLKLTSK